MTTRWPDDVTSLPPREQFVLHAILADALNDMVRDKVPIEERSRLLELIARDVVNAARAKKGLPPLAEDL